MGRPEKPPFIEIGQRFGRLEVIADLGVIQPAFRKRPGRSRPRQSWECICDCGKTIVTNKSQLISGMTRSCGCLQRDTVREIRQESAVHGHARAHGKTVEYQAWHAMINRCTNKNLRCYPDYGGRGIKVCRRWLTSFENFLADVGYKSDPKLTLGRINNDGNYTPQNVRWETLSENFRNRRSSRVISDGKRSMTLVEWSIETGLKRTTITQRIAKGWTERDAVTKPLRGS